MSEGTDGAAGPVLATIAYEDESGRHVYEVRKPEIVIGRGGVGYWVDLKLDVVADVSREHARLRRDETSGRFYIKDLSRFGTTVDGRPIASSVETRRGDERRDLGVEELLPPVARIGLAGLVFLDFKATPSP
jgi:pSer/pThr/pTyr-binding forkhead associated (FHA) protein